jgi:hypothetical protein
MRPLRLAPQLNASEKYFLLVVFLYTTLASALEFIYFITQINVLNNFASYIHLHIVNAPQSINPVVPGECRQSCAHLLVARFFSCLVI